MKRIQLPNPCFITLKGIVFFCLELHDLKPFKPKIFGGRTPPLPVTSTISKLPPHPYICVERLAIVQKTISYRQLTCMERRFKPYFCRMERITKPSFSVLFRFFFFFFLLVKNFRKVGPPPPDKNSSVRTWQLCRINMLVLLQVWMIALIRLPATSIFSISTSNHFVFCVRL